MRKRFLLRMLLCILLILSMGTYADADTDLTGHWAEETIGSWITGGYINGYPDGSFKPDNGITRAEFITLANKAFGFTKKAEFQYSDVREGDWFYSEVAIAVAAGYINGYPDGRMKPNEPISREEAASILMKIKNLQAEELLAAKFSDQQSLQWSRGAVGAVVKANIMVGYPDGSFKPVNQIKRGEAVIAMDRASGVSQKMVPSSAPAITVDDEKNTVTGMTEGMEYKLDQGSWTLYNSEIFKKLDLKGNHTLLVRFAANGNIPASLTSTYLFTVNVVPTSSGSSGGNSSGSITPPPSATSAAITNTTIQGVTVPVRGATPVSVITGSAQYTGTVSWTPAAVTFGPETVYTATITLTPQGIYTLTGVGANAFTVPGASATNAANSGIITAVFPATEPNPPTVISLTTIQGVTAPVRGATPVSVITETAQYTGTVSWTPAAVTFGPETVYTATITLTPKSGYTLTGVAANAFTVPGATLTTNTTSSGIITAIFPATEAAPVDPPVEPTVIFSRPTAAGTYWSAIGSSSEEINEVLEFLWREAGYSATIRGVELQSGVFSTSGGALVITADRITQSLLDWLQYKVYTDGLIALGITSSTGQDFLPKYSPPYDNIENTSGSTSLYRVLLNDYPDWSGSTVRVNLRQLVEGTNNGRLLMADGTTWADFQIITIGDFNEAVGITISSFGNATTITEDGGTLQMSAVVVPPEAYDKTITWKAVDGTPGDGSDTARIADAFDFRGILFAAKNGTVTVWAELVADPSITSNAIVVTITGQVGPAAPTGITTTNETSPGAMDGTLTGTQNGQEYQFNGTGDWIAIDGTTVTGLAPGSYTVRWAETIIEYAGSATEPLIIEAATIPAPDPAPEP